MIADGRVGGFPRKIKPHILGLTDVFSVSTTEGFVFFSYFANAGSLMEGLIGVKDIRGRNEKDRAQECSGKAAEARWTLLISQNKQHSPLNVPLMERRITSGP